MQKETNVSLSLNSKDVKKETSVSLSLNSKHFFFFIRLG